MTVLTAGACIEKTCVRCPGVRPCMHVTVTDSHWRALARSLWLLGGSTDGVPQDFGCVEVHKHDGLGFRRPYHSVRGALYIRD